MTRNQMPPAKGQHHHRGPSLATLIKGFTTKIGLLIETMTATTAHRCHCKARPGDTAPKSTPATSTNATRPQGGAYRCTGVVKWFNFKLGYGFITTNEGDIFVHRSCIKTWNRQHRLPSLAEGRLLILTFAGGRRGLWQCV